MAVSHEEADESWIVYERFGAGLMPHRSSDEPLCVIRRIPPPDQMEAVRSGTRPLGERLGKAVISLGRLIAQRFLSSSIPHPAHVSREGSHNECRGGPDDVLHDVVAESETVVGQTSQGAEAEGRNMVNDNNTSDSMRERGEGEETSGANLPAEPALVCSVVQPEEVAELRVFLLQQQQDIVRLASQIQELRSLVMAQQRMIAQLTETTYPHAVSLRPGGPPAAQSPSGRQGRPKAPKAEKMAAAKNESLWLPLNV
ncbi:MAG: hypothetical protein NNA18_04055 [Nitrospira sp.]|nr:hypothetical protein [Nitrospira sp.]